MAVREAAFRLLNVLTGVMGAVANPDSGSERR
jgi:hypothetical protein